MKVPFKQDHCSGQTALEYLLLLTVVAVVVIAGFRSGSLIDQIHDSAGGFYNSVTRVIMGENPSAVTGHWCPVQCTPAFSGQVIYAKCECPMPAFGGSCTDNGNPSSVTCP